MQIQWRNIIALILVIIVLVLLASNGPQIAGALTGLKQIGPGHTTDEKTIGLFVLGLIGLVLVAIVKILTTQGK
ncbi:MAG: hypothetical protein PCFJNLEI_01614 [Verrucomicrobiae bacterium]|nr:hypothetical protein [Verrucomicrobiae bacterium]